MRKLSIFIHLVVTAWVSYLAPWLLLVGIAAYFPNLSSAVHTGVYVSLALAAALLGGVILGRSPAWRARRLLLAMLAWAIAITVMVYAWPADGPTTVTGEDWADPTSGFTGLLSWALGMSAGLHIGGKYSRAAGSSDNRPDTSTERTPDR